MKIYVKNIEDVTLPIQGSNAAAGYDIIATSEPKIVGNIESEKEGEDVYYHSIDYIQYETNLYIAPSTQTHHVLIHPRSSISKYNLVLANSIGLVDNDYRGMILCRFKYCQQPKDLSCYHDGFLTTVDKSKIYQKGDKIAQLVAESTLQIEWVLVNDLNKTQRGKDGFGSTDIKKEEMRSNILEQYHKTGGISIGTPYSEQIKERNTI